MLLVMRAWASFDQGLTWQLQAQISDFAFIIYGLRDNSPPEVTIISPQGGKIFSGQLPITWTIEDNSDQNLNGSVTLLCSPDGGKSWNAIANGISNNGRFQWNTSKHDDSKAYLIKITAVDESRNIGVNISNETFVIDNTAPATMQSSIPSLADGENGWFKCDVAVALTPFDNISGVKTSMYKLNNGIWQDYTDVLSLSSDRIHEIIFYSVDNAGNLEKPNNVTIKIDRTSPATTCTLEPKSPTGENGWYIGNVTIILTASDDVSGANRTTYSIDDEKIKDYEETVKLINEGEYTLHYSSIDGAGNEEEQHTVSVRLDKTKPSANITSPEQGLYIFDRKILPLVNKILIIGKVTITVNAYDLISDINRVTFNSDAQRYIDSMAPYEWLWDEPGLAARTLTIFAYDNAGLVETDKIEVIIINI